VPAHERLRVVIVDDSVDDRAEVRRLLLPGSARRFELVEATTGAAGVRAILDAPGGPPDCAILDYRLPDMDAPEVLAAVLGPDESGVCPVVIITGDDTAGSGRAVLWAGAQDYVGKGWMTPDSLTRAVENAMERWAMARELGATEARLRLALEASKTGIWTRDLTGDGVTWSPECYAIYGVTEAAFDGTLAGFYRLVHPDDRSKLRAAAEAAVATYSHYKVEFRVVRPDGDVGEPLALEFSFSTVDGERHFEGRHVAERGADGEVEFVLAVTQDVTERRRTDAALQAALDRAQQAVRSRDDLVALVSHDLKNPLNTMLMGITVLEGKEVDQRRDILKMMTRQAQRMNKMVDELLDAAQLQSGMPLSFQLRETDLVSVTRALVEEYQHLAPDHRIEMRLASASLVGSWDPKRIERVVNNLLSNAIKYSPGGGTVQVTLGTVHEGSTIRASLRVTDEGMGIPPDDLARIFQWYSRGENAQRSRIEGTGIGLAGARDIVEQHGGTISVESNEGQGSTFTVTLPMVERPSPQILD
jgi:PAS domain S-box-containing protein